MGGTLAPQAGTPGFSRHNPKNPGYPKGAGFRVKGSELRIQDSGFMIQDLEFRYMTTV